MAILLEKLEIGKAEAEAENTGSNVLLTEVFDDYLDVMPKIENDDRFIIVGRKGAGKSAIAQYFNFEMKEQPYVYCAFINSQKIKLNNLIQTGESLKLKHLLDADAVHIFQWIILISLAEQLLKNEGVKDIPEFGSLQSFFKVNSGFVSLGGADLEETIIRHKGNVNIEGLSKFCKVNLGQEISSDKRLVKASFTSIIPELEKVVRFLIQNEYSKGNKYTIIFDDLDILFQEVSSTPILAELIRLVKHYNISFFNLQDTKVKILIFIRPDQLSRLVFEADINKILSSYAVNLQWYTQSVFHHDEDQLPLFKFINDRILASLKKNKAPVFQQRAWDILISGEDFPQASSFKYVLDRTLYRPRDLINLLNELKAKYPDKRLPISKRFLDKAIESYSTVLGDEVVNEISMSLHNDKITEILDYLRKQPEEFSSIDFCSQIKKMGIDPEETLRLLYKYGMVGIKNGNDRCFSFWGIDFELTSESQIIKHFGLLKFLSPTRNVQWW